MTLGEGLTPLIRLHKLGAAYGLDHLLLKNETTNPTWSHKDRLAAVTVEAARRAGASTVAAASTGNHGAAIAAYSAAAGLHCVIATSHAAPTVMQELIGSYGAILTATPSNDARYELVQQGVRRYGWYPASNLTTPPVGSDAYGIAGYSTIAYELFDELQAAPDWVAVPVAYGDCLAGIARGFAALQSAGLIDSVPRLIAAELFGSLERAVVTGKPQPGRARQTAALSIGNQETTYQAVAALRESEGCARSIGDDELLAARRALSSTEGLYAEAAAAAPLAAIRSLRAGGVIRPSDRVVSLLTSTGLKDTGIVRGDPAVALDHPDLDELRAVLQGRGLVDAEVAESVFAEV